VSLKNRALTPAQSAAVILGLTVVAGAGYGLYWVAARAWHERAVRAVIPTYLEGLRAQRDELSRAIERYRAQFGFYPPNHATNSDRALVNPLYYELAGTRWNTDLGTFGLPTTKDPVRPQMMRKNFGMSAFSNSLVIPAWPTNFIEGVGLAGREQDEIILVSSTTPDGIDEKLSDDFVSSPWRYVVDPAEHNPGKFDIWLELTVLNRHFKIGNWEGVR
jgi:hypothetical protein